MLIKLEILKVLRTKAIWVFILLAIVVNIVYAFATSQSSTIDYYNKLSSTTGIIYEKDFIDKLSSVKEPKASDDIRKYYLYKDYETAARQSFNVFEGLRGESLQNQISSDLFLSTSPLAQKIIHWKYEKLKPVIDQKAEDDDGKYVYFALETKEIHETIFTNFHKLLGTEVCLIFILIILYTLGYENMFGTESLVYTTRTGRKCVIHKGISGILASTGLCFLIYSVSALVMYGVNDLSLIWEQNISAQYNTVYYPQWGVYPFISWDSMSIREYFFGCAGVIFLHGILSSIFAAVFALIIRNVYVVFCVISGSIFIHFLLIWNINFSAFIFDLLLVPTLTQIWYCQWWFADGGSYGLIPHFETIYPIVCMVLLLPVLLIAFRYFNKKEFV